LWRKDGLMVQYAVQNKDDYGFMMVPAFALGHFITIKFGVYQQLQLVQTSDGHL